MCTLIAAFRKYPGSPLVIAANRDENLTRPASGPRVWAAELPFLAPKDEQAGGTWLGLNRNGVFVGVTNRFGATRDLLRESRGQLVIESLSARSAVELHQRLSTLRATRFNAFHLFYADRTDAFVTWSDGDRISHETLAPGLHVITERSYGAAEPARVARALREWPESSDGPPSFEAISRMLAIHDPADPLGSLCVHVPAFEYGTRSSFLLGLKESISDSQLWSSDQSPCEVLPVPRPELLAQLAAARPS